MTFWTKSGMGRRKNGGSVLWERGMVTVPSRNSTIMSLTKGEQMAQTLCAPGLWQTRGNENHPNLFIPSSGQLLSARPLHCLFWHLETMQHCLRNGVSGQMSVAIVWPFCGYKTPRSLFRSCQSHTCSEEMWRPSIYDSILFQLPFVKIQEKQPFSLGS